MALCIYAKGNVFGIKLYPFKILVNILEKTKKLKDLKETKIRYEKEKFKKNIAIVHIKKVTFNQK